jgi:hypothetical protein
MGKYVANQIYHFDLFLLLVANMKARKALADVTNAQGNSTAAAKRNISKIK